MSKFPFYSLDVAEIPQANATAVFSTPPNHVFAESAMEILPMIVTDKVTIMPWGADNRMPYTVMDHVESDETMATCMEFNSEVLYGAGLEYDIPEGTPQPISREVSDFFACNDIPSYFMGVTRDFKYFGFAVSVIILSKDYSRILSIRRKEACYCRFSPADGTGRIRKIHYANWRKASLLTDGEIETIDLLDPDDPLTDLRNRITVRDAPHKYAIVTRIPTIDHTYYPIPYYGALFRGKWYDIKRLIGIAKEAKLRNSAPLKYHITIAPGYWERVCKEEGITSPRDMRNRMIRGKQEILDFLTGAENSGKTLFSSYSMPRPDGSPNPDITITKIDAAVQGGDWATDIQEAVNMICFTLRVHSNLVGSVPGKSQSNNSGSDKRELYTIAQALQKPYRDLLFGVHRLIIRYNGWKGVRPHCPFIQLTTLDEHTDAKPVEI